MQISGENTEYYDETDWHKYRKEKVSIIHQNYNLIENYTVYQNIELAYEINNKQDKEKSKQDILNIISRVVLSDQSRQRVATLSGGQKQRVAIARALAKNTPIILADEPTGNLDSENANGIISLLKSISHDKLVVVVTHNVVDFKNSISREICLSDGKILHDIKYDGDRQNIYFAVYVAIMVSMSRNFKFQIMSRFL
jgi:ABC-type lipoprotein export system ATPase subunit